MPDPLSFINFLNIATTPNPHLRAGQRFFNYLSECRPDLSAKIQHTDLNPFYLDANLFKCIKWLSENW